MARASDPVKAREVATAIVRRLREAGHAAYFAGGCVRDALLGLAPTDFDIATDATPQRVRELFPRTAEVGAAFGVVLVQESVPLSGRGEAGGRRERVSVEVATFRSDGPYTDARRPDVVHFSDPPSDAARRDFTINALFLDPLAAPDPSVGPELAAGGRVIDFVGGVKDLTAKLIRAVGDPDKRLAEDHLRALRAVRFASRLGFTIESATAAAISRHAAELRGVSRERIGEELRRMLGHPSRAAAIARLQSLGLDAPVLMEPTRDAPTTLLAGLPATGTDLALSLAAWLIDRLGASRTGLGDETIDQVIRNARRALCLSNVECEDISAILHGHQRVLRAWDSAATARRKRWAAARWFDDAVGLVGTVQPDRAAAVFLTKNELSKDGVGLSPVPLISGDDLVRAGMSPGPLFRRILDEVYDAQLEGQLLDKAAAMELAAKLCV